MHRERRMLTDANLIDVLGNVLQVNAARLPPPRITRAMISPSSSVRLHRRRLSASIAL